MIIVTSAAHDLPGSVGTVWMAGDAEMVRVRSIIQITPVRRRKNKPKSGN